MKKQAVWSSISALACAALVGGAALLYQGCTKSNPMGYSSGSSGTVSVSAVPSGGSYVFSPTSITISSGTAVSFDLSNAHTVHIDDGTGTGTCGSVDYAGPTWPYVYSGFVGTAGTVYKVHCDIHSGCGAGSCLNCTGMVMSVYIN